jgi:hypothetical protein
VYDLAFHRSLNAHAMTITSQNKTDAKVSNNRTRLFDLFKSRPMSDEELLVNLGMYMRSGALAKILFLDEIYKRVVGIPGHIMEFGVWWGQSVTTFENLRAIHEPYNHQRHVVAFDTFTGYPEVGSKDRESDIISTGVYKVNDGYEKYLEELVDFHEKENVMSHIKKHSIVKGDVRETLPAWLTENPQAFVSLAFFDMALYEPTKLALQAILPRLIKGSIIVFDELNHKDYPGETEAALEILGTSGFTIENSKILPDRVMFTKI